MTNLEYIRQLPGLENFTFTDVLLCTKDIGLDEDCCGDCEECENEEATINGKPAPYIFTCPVKPGQKVYVLVQKYNGEWKNKVFESTINRIEFDEDEMAMYDDEAQCDFSMSNWLWNVFPTREQAEQKLKEMLNDGK